MQLFSFSNTCYSATTLGLLFCCDKTLKLHPVSLVLGRLLSLRLLMNCQPESKYPRRNAAKDIFGFFCILQGRRRGERKFKRSGVSRLDDEAFIRALGQTSSARTMLDFIFCVQREMLQLEENSYSISHAPLVPFPVAYMHHGCYPAKIGNGLPGGELSFFSPRWSPISFAASCGPEAITARCPYVWGHVKSYVGRSKSSTLATKSFLSPSSNSASFQRTVSELRN